MMRILLAIFFVLAACSARAQTTVFSATFQSDGSGNAGYSARVVIPSISAGGSQIRITVGSDTTGAFSASHASVCVQAAAYNCQTAPVEVKFGGAAGFSNPTNAAPLASDWTNFASVAGQSLLVILDVTSGPVPKNGAGSTYWSSVQVPSWNVATPGGSWPSYALVYGPTKVEVQNGGPPPPPPPPPPSTGLTADGIAGGGRLTIAHGVAKLYQDTQASFIDYAPDAGVTMPLIDPINGVAMVKFTASDADAAGLSMMIDSTWPANGIFDVYGYIGSGGAANLCTGPQWSGNTPAIPDQLFRGVKVNGAAMSCRSSPTQAFQCAVAQCSYLGTVKISPVAGVIRCDFTGGKKRECGIWNKDNRIDGVLLVTVPGPAFFYDLSSPGGPSTPPGNQIKPVGASGGDFDLYGSALVGRLGPLVEVNHTLNHRGMRLGGEANSAYAISVGWNDPHAFCGNITYAGNFGTDGRGINATMNQEYYGTSIQMVVAQTMTAWCRPAPYQGLGTAWAVEWQEWYSGQNWIDSGDQMMSIKFRY